MFEGDRNVLLITSLLVTILSLQVYFLLTRTEGITLDVLDRETSVKDIYLRADILESIQSRLQTLEQKLNKLETSHRKVEDIERNVQTITTMMSKYTSIEFKVDNAFESFAHVKELAQNIERIETDVLNFKTVITKTANEVKQTVQQISSDLKSDMDSKSTKLESDIQTLRQSVANKMYSSKDKRVSFAARSPNTLTCIGPECILEFTQVIHNEGNGYSIHDGKFTAPEDGVYLFLFSIEARPRFSFWTPAFRATVDLVVDDTFKASAVATSVNIEHLTTGSNAVITYVQKGQKVWVHTHGDLKDEWININPHRTTFTGVLLYQ